jgi:hypothetical protein
MPTVLVYEHESRDAGGARVGPEYHFADRTNAALEVSAPDGVRLTGYSRTVHLVRVIAVRVPDGWAVDPEQSRLTGGPGSDLDAANLVSRARRGLDGFALDE